MATHRLSQVLVGDNDEIIDSIKSRIKQIDLSRNNLQAFSLVIGGTIVHQDRILVDRKDKKILRVYYAAEGVYKIGWIVDGDISQCLICSKPFNWLRFKHHCRACGLVVCSDCSPFRAHISCLNEAQGSRVCRNCFGLKTEEFSVTPKRNSNDTTPLSQRRNSTGRVTSLKYQGPTPEEQLAAFELLQQPLYREAYM